jgi:hypothetical protein
LRGNVDFFAVRQFNPGENYLVARLTVYGDCRQFGTATATAWIQAYAASALDKLCGHSK